MFKIYIRDILVFLITFIIGSTILVSLINVTLIPNDPASRFIAAKNLKLVFSLGLPPLIYLIWHIILKFFTLDFQLIIYIQILSYFAFCITIYFLLKVLYKNLMNIWFTFIAILLTPSILFIFVSPNYYSLELILISFSILTLLLYIQKDKFSYLFITLLLTIIAGYLHYPALSFFFSIYSGLFIFRKKMYFLKTSPLFLLLIPLCILLKKYNSFIENAKEWPISDMSWHLKFILKIPGEIITLNPNYAYIPYIILCLFIGITIYVFLKKKIEYLNRLFFWLIVQIIFYIITGYILSKIHNYTSLTYILALYLFLLIFCYTGVTFYQNRYIKILLYIILLCILYASNLYCYRKYSFHNQYARKEFEIIKELLKNKSIDFVLHTNVMSYNPYKAMGISKNKCFVYYNNNFHFHNFNIDNLDKVTIEDIMQHYKTKKFVIVNSGSCPESVQKRIEYFLNKADKSKSEYGNLYIYHFDK